MGRTSMRRRSRAAVHAASGRSSLEFGLRQLSEAPWRRWVAAGSVVSLGSLRARRTQLLHIDRDVEVETVLDRLQNGSVVPPSAVR